MKHFLMSTRWVGLLACVASTVLVHPAQATESSQPPQPTPSAAQFAEVPVAGLAPYERPAGAPVIAELKRSTDWRAKVLHGVSEPIPPTLKFLDDEGVWYTPFDFPGMLDRYDIRGWHAKAAP